MFNFIKQIGKKYSKTKKKSFWQIVAISSLIIIVIIALLYILSKPKEQKITVFSPDNKKISENIEAKNLDLTKSLSLDFSWKNSLIDRKKLSDELSLHLKNTANYNIYKIKIFFNASAGVKIDKNSEIIEIESLSPGEEKGLKHLIKLEVDKEILNANFEAVVEYEVMGKKIRSEFNIPPLKIEAFITTKAFAVYTTPEGDKLGLGPLPPVALEPTNYWVFFETLALGDISDFVLKANLSEETDFLNNYSLLSGNLNYNPDNKEISWHIPNIKNGEDKHRLGLEIMFLPKKEQVNESPIMINNIKYFAIDENSQQEISGQLSDITTDIKEDFYNPEEGKVKNNSL
jgi:hypothetical protein